MIEITARQIGGLIVVVSDYIKLHRAHGLIKEINDLQPKRIEK